MRRFVFGECSESAVELDPGFAESILECGDELTRNTRPEHFDGKKKGVVGGDPASVVRSQAASGDDAVNMRMMLQSLSQVWSTLKKPISAPR